MAIVIARDATGKAHSLSYAALLATSGRALRVFYNVTTGLLDPLGDAQLRDMHLERPFSFGQSPDDLYNYAALVSRPYFLCKVDREAHTDSAGDGDPATFFQRLTSGDTVRMHFARSPRSRDDGDQPSLPFDPSATAGTVDPLVLFDDATLVPLLTCRVVTVEILRNGAASGMLSVVKE